MNPEFKKGDKVICISRFPTGRTAHGLGWDLGKIILINEVHDWNEINVYFPTSGCGVFDGEIERYEEKISSWEDELQ